MIIEGRAHARRKAAIGPTNAIAGTTLVESFKVSRIQPAPLDWPHLIPGERHYAITLVASTVHPTSRSARAVASRQARSAARSSSRALWTAFESVSDRSLVPSISGLSSNCGVEVGKSIMLQKRRCERTGVINFYSRAEPFLAAGCIVQVAPSKFVWRS